MIPRTKFNRNLNLKPNPKSCPLMLTLTLDPTKFKEPNKRHQFSVVLLLYAFVSRAFQPGILLASGPFGKVPF